MLSVRAIFSNASFGQILLTYTALRQYYTGISFLPPTTNHGRTDPPKCALTIYCVLHELDNSTV
jgi:hypothetical protein